VAAGRIRANGAGDPLTLRTRDTHQNLTIIADPYVTADRYTKTIFGKTSPYEAGIVAINIYLRNDNDTPIRLNLNTILLMISVPRQDPREAAAAHKRRRFADRAILKGKAPSGPRLPSRVPGAARARPGKK